MSSAETRESVAPAQAARISSPPVSSPTHAFSRASHAPSQHAQTASERPSAPALEPILGTVVHADDDDAHLLADFFSSPPPSAAPEAFDDTFDEHEVLRMSRGSRRAMWASLGLFGASVLGIGAFIAYHQFVMPEPVELAGASEVVSPLQPLAARPETSISAATDSTQPRYLLTAAAASTPQPSAATRMLLPGEEPAVAAADPSPGQAAVAPQLAAAQVALQPVVAPGALAQAQPAAQPAAAPAGNIQPAAQAPQPMAAQPLPIAKLALQVNGAPASAPEAARPQLAAADPVPANTPAAAPVLPVPVQPLASGNSPEPTFDELLAVAHSFVRRGNNQTALEAFEHALRVRPEAPTALSGKALTYLNMEDTRAAKLYASRAVAADPTNSEGWIVLGAAEEQLGARDAAREAYKHCAEQGVGNYVGECRQLVR